MVSMVCVMIIKATKQNFLRIGFIIPIRVFIEDQIGSLRNIDTFRCNLETYRKVNTI